ncbi:quinol dehydrogenase ferredoxin subunit NapH [Helicobacter sp.]|uniref:quinol dehydrogenase ferredoxin subunit NapH n=1 Tax=Helicobacter sp. TaxID=218 RepID=UPI002A78A50A|nr:quinol dehydrogenase ferredoxin subunit NapH [Helicobacter sp.]MDY2823182.1 quinol dehydrogenase ferredoxin subunit NapH [Helicobacter sp.]
MWLKKHRFLLLRRFTQIGILILFFVANCSFVFIDGAKHFVTQGDLSAFESGERNLAIAHNKHDVLPFRILEGNLSGSKILETIPMSDPLAFLQIFLAGGAISMDLLLGVLVVILVYGLFLGRGYCAFVCPINMVSDLANFLRRKLHIENVRFLAISRKAKFGVLFLSLLLSLVFGVLAWESISPISMLHRGVVFGMGVGFFGVLGVFLFDLFVLKNGFCGHICPLGAVYGLIGSKAMLRVRHNVQNCTKCMDCVRICPENQVLRMVGKYSAPVSDMACIKCGRCIEVCNDNALGFSILDYQKGEKK